MRRRDALLQTRSVTVHREMSQDEMKAFFSKFLELEPGYADAENVRRLIDGQK